MQNIPPQVVQDVKALKSTALVKVQKLVAADLLQNRRVMREMEKKRASMG
jgi:hypothetical protein